MWKTMLWKQSPKMGYWEGTINPGIVEEGTIWKKPAELNFSKFFALLSNVGVKPNISCVAMQKESS